MALWTKASLCGKSSLLEQSLPRTPSRQKQNQCNLRNLRLKNSCLCVFVAINPQNLRNLCPRYPWLINDLRVCKALYICRDSSTDIESSLQIRLFMQNKANFRKVKLNVNKVLTKDYKERTLGQRGKTKPIKANQSQLKPIQTQLKPKQTQYKAKQSQFRNVERLLALESIIAIIICLE